MGCNRIKIMKSPEYIVHGTSSEEDALKIEEHGFEADEGRASVSTDLIMAFNWALNKEKRKASKSETEVKEDEEGRIIIMGVPEDKVIDYGEQTEIEVDDNKKEVTGFVSRYENGRRYLAIYNDSKESDQKQIIPKENILMSIIPSSELKFKLDELKSSIKKLGKIDSVAFSREILDIIKNDKNNFIAEGKDISEIINSLVISTIESEVIRSIRALSIDVKRVLDYKIINKGEDITNERVVEKEKLIKELERVKILVEDENFDIGLENLNRYIKLNVSRFINELTS